MQFTFKCTVQLIVAYVLNTFKCAIEGYNHKLYFLHIAYC